MNTSPVGPGACRTWHGRHGNPSARAALEQI
jgi:hypothetical protein